MLIIRRLKFYYTASGIVTTLGGRPVHRLREDCLLYVFTCFEHYVLIIRRSKLYYTASGIITPVGGGPVHRLGEDSQPVHRTAACRM
jgi:hypothetical protein